MKKNLIVGAGLSGAVLANLLANNNEKVVIIDRREDIAGNICDYLDNETGINIHKYGPHIFHTNNKKVWDYLSKFTEWYPYVFKPSVVIEGKTVTLPFNLTTLHELFSSEFASIIEKKLIKKYGLNTKVSILDLRKNKDKDLIFIAEYVFENVFKNYTIKQWGITPEEIDSSVLERVPVTISYDNRYFQDEFQGIPLNGYKKMIQNMLNHPNIKVCLNTEYKEIQENFDKIFYSGAIDEFFDYKFGELPYRSLNFDIKTLNQEFYQKTAMVNYPNDYDFTRIIEHKHFLDKKSEKTVISIEYPCSFEISKNERFYPIVSDESKGLYKKYKSEALKFPNLYFIGRLGEYKYLNMDSAVERIFSFYENYIKE